MLFGGNRRNCPYVSRGCFLIRSKTVKVKGP